MHLPFHLMRHHGRMISTLLNILLRSKLRSGKPRQNPASFPAVITTLRAPDNRLVDHYCVWSGADRSKYSQTLPPHLFSQFTLPVCAQQLQQTRYDLSRIINQGCALRRTGELMRDQPIHIRCELIEIRETESKADILQRLFLANTPDQPVCEVDFRTTFLLGPRTARSKSQETELSWQTAGHWSAESNAGWQFALLTGDFNPLHWLRPVARMTPFKGTILHGFGMFARTFEQLEAALKKPVTEIDVRFVSPVRLPSSAIAVEYSVPDPEQGTWQLRQTDARGKVQLRGQFRCDPL